MSSGDSGLSHPGNLLGALTVAIGDRMGDAITEAAGGSGSVAAALSSLEDFLEAPTIGLLQQVLGLTPSGAVRLVDRLQELGFVERAPGDDARTRHLTLTRRGRSAATSVRHARALVIESALGRLSPAERRNLDKLLAKILSGLRREPGATGWTCRLCDTTACARDRGRCPFVPKRPAEGVTDA